MVTLKEKIKVYIKKQLVRNIYLFMSKLFDVLLTSSAIMLVLGLLKYEYTLRNFFSCMALYFVYEELKPQVSKIYKKRIKTLRGIK